MYCLLCSSKYHWTTTIEFQPTIRKPLAATHFGLCFYLKLFKPFMNYKFAHEILPKLKAPQAQLSSHSKSTVSNLANNKTFIVIKRAHHAFFTRETSSHTPYAVRGTLSLLNNTKQYETENERGKIDFPKKWAWKVRNEYFMEHGELCRNDFHLRRV